MVMNSGYVSKLANNIPLRYSEVRRMVFARNSILEEVNKIVEVDLRNMVRNAVPHRPRDNYFPLEIKGKRIHLGFHKSIFYGGRESQIKLIGGSYYVSIYRGVSIERARELIGKGLGEILDNY
jgi:hypothetical protein